VRAALPILRKKSPQLGDHLTGKQELSLMINQSANFGAVHKQAHVAAQCKVCKHSDRCLTVPKSGKLIPTYSWGKSHHSQPTTLRAYHPLWVVATVKLDFDRSARPWENSPKHNIPQSQDDLRFCDGLIPFHSPLLWQLKNSVGKFWSSTQASSCSGPMQSAQTLW